MLPNSMPFYIELHTIYIALDNNQFIKKSNDGIDPRSGEYT